ncbi:hypothetical protein E1B28_013011 [Marasmius oreades]|uniref:Antigenic cell wall galactomannoprotein n=1 Tax=Marasmius oreades TaxID=181124 RepID=A0A9P7ULG9_9AGAR|nr:uncharacterized protein E1B28_013011 [Marasmius oreades]KAG7087032.1 hypothetical protein E1B28_013011 [Marasmius oreades]
MLVFTHFVILLSAASALAIPRKCDVASVKAAIAKISNQVTDLDNKITAFPDTGGNLGSALAIHSSAGNLGTLLKSGASDTQATAAFSEANGQTILASVEKFEPTILDTLKVIIAKKPAFQALLLPGITGLVLQDLQALNTNTGAFADALIAKSPVC